MSRCHHCIGCSNDGLQGVGMKSRAISIARTRPDAANLASVLGLFACVSGALRARHRLRQPRNSMPMSARWRRGWRRASVRRGIPGSGRNRADDELRRGELIVERLTAEGGEGLPGAMLHRLAGNGVCSGSHGNGFRAADEELRCVSAALRAASDAGEGGGAAGRPCAGDDACAAEACASRW